MFLKRGGENSKVVLGCLHKSDLRREDRDVSLKQDVTRHISAFRDACDERDKAPLVRAVSVCLLYIVAGARAPMFQITQ